MVRLERKSTADNHIHQVISGQLLSTLSKRTTGSFDNPEGKAMTIQGTCLCGAVEFTYHGEPPFLVDCNCTACRRYAPLWAHGARKQLDIKTPKDGLVSFTRGGEKLAFHSCKTCGCTTHWTSTDLAEDASIAINARHGRSAINLLFNCPEI